MAHLQFFLSLSSAMATIWIYYKIMQSLEENQGKRDLIAEVKPSDYNITSHTALFFKAAKKQLVYESTQNNVGSHIIVLGAALSVGLFMFLIFFLPEFGNSPTNYEPSFRIIGPIIVPMFTVGFTLFLPFQGFIQCINKIKGVSGYSIMDNVLVIHSGFKDTIVPILQLIESVSIDKIIIEEHREGRNLIYSRKNIQGQPLTIERESALPQYSCAPYLSKDTGDIVSVHLRDGKTILALTPDDEENFVKEIKNRIL